uniref:Uncharacterized protein n=1 Tax=Leersia perrieri TaxID=77586 RepID=A0A0D9XY21_9ORYZ
MSSTARPSSRGSGSGGSKVRDDQIWPTSKWIGGEGREGEARSQRLVVFPSPVSPPAHHWCGIDDSLRSSWEAGLKVCVYELTMEDRRQERKQF